MGQGEKRRGTVRLLKVTSVSGGLQVYLSPPMSISFRWVSCGILFICIYLRETRDLGSRVRFACNLHAGNQKRSKNVSERARSGWLLAAETAQVKGRGSEVNA